MRLKIFLPTMSLTIHIRAKSQRAESAGEAASLALHRYEPHKHDWSWQSRMEK
jgi:hypothetical protein